jgi:hypothetical protein
MQFVTWKWNADHWKKRTAYTAAHVNTLYSMLQRHYQASFELVCITDDAAGLVPEVQAIPIWDDFRKLGRCWRRLRIFSCEMQNLIGPRFVSIDLDTVIVADITSLFSVQVPFKIWGEYWRRTPYCGSLMMMDAGAREFVWETFPEQRHDYRANEFGRMPYGSDQDHITRCLFPFEPMWTMEDGIHNFNYTVRRWNRFAMAEKSNSKYHNGDYARLYEEATGRSDWGRVIQRPAMGGNGEIPPGARIIFFNGKYDPSDPELQKEYPWIKEHWQ